ncbi:hypothetical protein [Bradyrhizobium sp. LTSPM299]|jgi:hypothetical protein|uniref:hypothetical protein n=1 Tax=Bradyrhizobium sp. LTSPM299 TaxID=1619233 RepID=UPI000AACC6CF|nr:hypothetical protein [Bradyrhizobium sp. LTSPM299]
MSLHSVRAPTRIAAATHCFPPRSACGPIEPILPALLRSVVFFAALAMPFVVALFAA